MLTRMTLARREPSKDEIIRVQRERELKGLPNIVPMKSASAMKGNHPWAPQFTQRHQAIKNITSSSLMKNSWQSV